MIKTPHLFLVEQLFGQSRSSRFVRLMIQLDGAKFVLLRVSGSFLKKAISKLLCSELARSLSAIGQGCS